LLSTLGFELEFCPKENTCNVCDGVGNIRKDYEPDTDECLCDTCNDTGKIECLKCGGNGEITCPICGGIGCEECGSGYLECPECNGECMMRCPECDSDMSYVPDEMETYIHSVTCPECDGRGSFHVFPDLLTSKFGTFVLEATVSMPSNDSEGGEFVSNVFSSFGDIQNCVKNLVHQIEHIADSAGELSCGLHVHIVPRNGWSNEMLRKLIVAWAEWGEDLFMEEFSPNKQRIKSYSRQWGCKKDIVELDKIYDDDDSDFVNQVFIWNDNLDRDATLNLLALKKHGTVEFRLFDGTLSEVEILQAISWVIDLIDCLYEDNTYDAFYSKVLEKEVA